MHVAPHRRTHHYLKGPIPWWWLAEAIALPGRALPVALVIWLWSGMRRSTSIRLSTRHIFSTVGISRFAVYRALDQLAQAGLIAVERHRGRPPLVTILMETQKAR